MEVNDRIKQLRKELDMTQTDFGAKISMTQSHLASVENGKRNVTDRNIKLICAELNVNEQWLRTGEGEMFTQGDANTLSRLSEEYNLSDIEYAFMAEYLKLPQAHRAIMNGYLRGVVGRLTETPDGQQVIATPQPAQSSIEAELEAYRLELEAEEKGTISSPSAAQSGA